MTPLSLAAMATTPGTSPESAARWSTWSICFVMVTLPPGWLSADGIPLTARSPPGHTPFVSESLRLLEGLARLTNRRSTVGRGGGAMGRWIRWLSVVVVVALTAGVAAALAEQGGGR